MNKTLSNSEFCQMLANIFPALNDHDRNIMVFNDEGNCAIFAKETAKGYSSATIFGKPYGKMSAAEKQAAVDAVLTLPVEIAVEKWPYGNGEYKTYWVTGGWNKRLEKDHGQHWYEKKKADLIRIENYRNF